MASAIATFQFAEFVPENESFAAYVKRLKQYFLLHDIKEEKQVPAILSFIGAKTYSLLTNLTLPDDPAEKNFEEIVTIIQNHLSPPPNKITERIKFRKRLQFPGESIQQFCAELKKLTTHCKFSGDTLNENLLEQFLRGLSEENIQQRLLSQVSDLTFENAVQQAVVMQSAKNDLHDWRNKSATINKVNTFSKKVASHSSNDKNMKPNNRGFALQKDNRNKNTKCYRCGDKLHLANKCKFITATCHACGKVGHLKTVCISSTKSANTNALDVVDILCVNKSNSTNPIIIRVKVNNKAYADMELDTGSAVSTIPIARFQRIFPNEKVNSADVRLRTATGEIVDPAGYAKVSVEYKNQSKLLKLYLINDATFPLLFGRDWLREFQIPPNEVNVYSTNVNIDSEPWKKLLKSYDDIFTETVGEIQGIKAQLNMSTDAVPIFCKARTVTYALRKPVEEELQRLQESGVLQSVNHSKWATPIVPVVKPNGKIRICGDFKVTVNKFLNVDKYPLPKIDDILHSLAGGKHFTKIDLNQAYLHLPVEEESQNLLTINTHKGLFQFTRLPYGISSSPAIWQRTIEQILNGIEGVNVFIDDICITGVTDEIHLQRLEEVFKRLREYNLKVNVSKSSFFTDSITYCGYKIDEKGIHKTEEKIEAIRKAPRPTNVTQVKAFLGLVSYYSRFIPDLATVVHPLNKLLRKNTPFRWSTECGKAFNAIKQEIISEKVLVHFDPDLPLVLSTDASSYGISAVLSHTMPDGSEKPVAFASRTLNVSERRYSQIDKEALAIIFGVKKFFQFLYGKRFTLYTDNKPLVSIFAPDKSIPLLSAARMQRYALYLQSFQYDIRYKSTATHGNADALSRLPLRSEDWYNNNVVDEAEILQINQLETLPVTAKSLAIKTKDDPMLRLIFQSLISGTEISKSLLFGGKQEEFTLQQGCILKGCRVVIPEIYRPHILQELHTGHFGVVKMKTLARNLVWWPGIDSDIEKMAKNCTSCVLQKNNPPKVATHAWEWPTAPMQRIHVDFAGPVNGKMLFLVVDAHSKWPEVFILDRITSDKTIQCLDCVFSRYGLPSLLVSDNGGQFTSEEFSKFLKENGILHHLTAPYHPASNGQAERFVQTIKNKLKTLENLPGNLQTKVNKFLMQFRKMPHSTTGESPALLFLKRNIKTKIDLVLPDVAQHVRKRQFFKNDNPRMKEFHVGEKVAARNYTREGKWKIGYIISRVGKLHYKVQIEDCVWKRHVDQLSPVGQDIPVTDAAENTSQVPTSITALPQNIEWHPTASTSGLDTQLPKQCDPVKDTVTSTAPTSNQEVLQKSMSIPPPSNFDTEVRRSSRIKKHPDRLAYK